MTPDQKTEILRRWVETDQSAQDIASALRISKNAVIGVTHRFAKSKNARDRAHLQELMGVKVTARKSSTPRFGRPVDLKKQEKAVALAEVARRRAEIAKTAKAARVHGGVSMMKLVEGMCRAIIGEGRDGDARYCGDPVARKSYCDAHCKRFYLKPAKRERVSRTHILPRLHVAVN